jgi:hypothetical protein
VNWDTHVCALSGKTLRASETTCGTFDKVPEFILSAPPGKRLSTKGMTMPYRTATGITDLIVVAKNTPPEPAAKN